MSVDLPPPLDGEVRRLASRAGDLTYYVSGDGPPVLLVHSINAAGSAYEMKPLFEALSKDYRVFAVDLPGFGLSDRSDRDYNIALFTTAVEDMLYHIGETTNEPSRIVGLSLSSEFIARALTGDYLQTNSTNVGAVVMITPTGFRRGDENRIGPAGKSLEVRWLSRLLGRFGIGRRAFKLLARPTTIRYFLKRTWGSPNIDEGLLRYDTLTTQQPGAQFAPLAFLSAKLFSRDCHTLYRKLRLPVLVLHGTRGDFKDFRGAQWTNDLDNWRFVAYDTGALVHFEKTAEVIDEISDFFESTTD